MKQIFLHFKVMWQKGNLETLIRIYYGNSWINLMQHCCADDHMDIYNAKEVSKLCIKHFSVCISDFDF